MGNALPARLVRTTPHGAKRTEFPADADLVAEMTALGYEVTGYNSNPSHRSELQGRPKFRGLYGPMWDGDAIRYEDPTTQAICTDLPVPAKITAMARVVDAPSGATVRLNFEILGGAHAGARFAVPRELEPRYAANVGAEIAVSFYPDDQFAYPDPVLAPTTAIPVEPIPRNRYEEKVEAKRERYAERAQAARSVAASKDQTARTIMDAIPMGQPILVGHHSERRHRKDLERRDNALRASAEASDKAAYYDDKAKNYGTHGVSSDDPDAVIKLRAQLAERKETRNAEKLWNRQLKVAARDKAKEVGRELTQRDHVALVEALDIPPTLKNGLLSYARAFPWLPQFGTGTQADIRRIEQRIAELEQKAAQPEREPMKGEIDGTTYTVEWNKADNRVQVFFGKRPSDETCEKLRSRGFKWARSVGAWQRHASEGAWYHARTTLGHKEPTRETRHCDGCDSDQPDVRDYIVTHHDDTQSPSAYCGDCAALARADYNGETKSITEVSK